MSRAWPRMLAGAVVFVALASPAGASAAEPLRGQWHLDAPEAFATSFDSSGNGLHGAISTFGATPFEPGKFGGAFRFADTGEGPGRVTVPASELLEPQAVTTLAWVRASSNPGPLRVIVAKGGTGCTAASFSLYNGVGSAQGPQFYVFDGVSGHFSPSAGTGVWDGQWHLVAGTFDGATVRLYVDGRQVGNGTAAAVNIAYGLAQRQFVIGDYVNFCPDPGYFGHDIDEVRIYSRALTESEIARLAAAPGPGPPELIPDGAPGAGGGTPPPRVTDLRPITSPAAGKALVLNAAIAGDYRRLEWNLRGSAGPEIVSGPGQTAIRLRPKPGPFTVEVTPVGVAGRGPPLSESFAQPSYNPKGLARQIDRRLSGKDPVYAAGPPDVINRLKDPGKLCVITGAVVRAGPLELEGCFTPITSLDQIPAAERGIVEPLADALALASSKRGAFGLRTMLKVLDLTDGYISRGPVTVNGVTLTPKGGAAVLVYPQADTIVSSDAGMAIGALQLDNPRSFVLDTGIRGGRIPLGEFPRIAKSLPRIAGFDLVGNVKVNLLPASGAAPAEARITTSLKLPEFLKVGGVDLQSRVELRATAAQGLIVDNMTIGPLNVDLGALAVDDFKIDYRSAEREWTGQGKACVAGGACLDMTPPNGRIVIRNGALEFAGASLEFPPPGIPLYPGIALDRIGFGFGLNPTRFTGNAAITAVKLYVIDGRLFFAFPSAATPYVLDRNEVGGGFPPQFYGQSFTRPTFGITANASLKLGIGTIRLGGGYFLYEYPGYVAFGGGVTQGIAGVIEFNGGFAGEFNVVNGRFNLSGSVEACVVDILCRKVFGLISSRGAAACVTLGPVSIGGGVQFSPFDVTLWPLDGCKWSPFAETNVRGARAAQAGGAYVVNIERGDPSRAIELKGAGGAPRVRVTGPGGQALESPAGPGIRTEGALRILRSEQLGTTVVGLQDPRPGRYRIEPLPGSPVIAKVSEAEDPPDARARVKIRGTGTKRVLAYDVRRRARQRVTFVEVSAGGSARVLGTVEGGRGKLRFQTAPGRGRSSIEARFELDGIPAETRTVARFRPASPRLGAPKRLRIRRRGEMLGVSWRAVSEATRYRVVATSAAGLQRSRLVRARSVKLKGIPTTSGGRVTVQALDGLRRGRPARARFARTAKGSTRFARLARCRTAGSRIACRGRAGG